MEVTIYVHNHSADPGVPLVSERTGLFVSAGQNGVVIRAGGAFFMYPWSAMRSCEFEIPDNHEMALARHFAGQT